MTQTRQRPVTIVEVADAAGVSIGTVSRFLNGLPVKPANHTSVAEAIERLGYRRNALASAMKATRTGLIGVLVPNLDEFHSALVTQLTIALRRMGMMSVSHCHDNAHATVATALDFFRNYRVDTLVMGGSEAHAAAIRELIETGTPVVTYDNPQADLSLNGVEVDNIGGARAATEHLIKAGHRRIGILTGTLTARTSLDRLAGWRMALEAAGLEAADDLIHESNWTRAGGAEGMAHFLAMEDPPTAVFGANFRTATGALTHLRQKGLRIPEEISLVSFDDSELFRLSVPPITAVAQPVDLIAERLAARVAENCGLRPADPKGQGRIVLPVNLITRGSVAPPNSRKKGASPDAGT
ncbi:LacI family DNA-binding transcriptional regulator [Pseudoruegeria sp. SHC-113]|uniref:LacI family DNA-binding transcriptional regulator n=1 Tax=Pseudoruegeria sp. SHC-113 TaxID=2855439 RepID=UPI0021BB1184|nr:LacI family DNA-binding transcriptional regulator [Pseudoruegeria sp. SHC-113]MCT8160675.1 LacI family transcriptional regulator [Pseudoruegeria sp. SHC-113]